MRFPVGNLGLFFEMSLIRLVLNHVLARAITITMQAIIYFSFTDGSGHEMMAIPAVSAEVITFEINIRFNEYTIHFIFP